MTYGWISIITFSLVEGLPLHGPSYVVALNAVFWAGSGPFKSYHARYERRIRPYVTVHLVDLKT